MTNSVRNTDISFWIIWVALVIILSYACTTMSLPNNSTPEAKRQAMCQDAQFAYNLSVVMLEQHLSTAQTKAYWESYKAGAALAIQTYCTDWTRK